MSQPVKIDVPSEDENAAALNEFFSGLRAVKQERLEAVNAAAPALERLCQVMRDRSGQPYKVRALLFSLWNGKPADVSEVLNLDWAIRRDLCAVILAFGFDAAGISFWYDEITAALKKAGQFEWFIQEGEKAKEEA